MTTQRIDGRLRFVQALGLDRGELHAEELVRRLDQTPITIAVGPTAETFDTQTTALTAVNLLGRLFRQLRIVAPNEVAVHPQLPFVQGKLGPALVAFAQRVHADVQVELAIAPGTDGVTLYVASGDGPTRAGHVYCAGSGWLARVSRQPVVVEAGSGGNPIGPLIAAALGAAEVFKIVLGAALPAVEPAEDVAFSALTYRVATHDVGPSLREPRLPDTTLVGAGSIGSALLWGLAHLRRARGALTIVDDDHLEDHNPDRAILVLDDTAARGLEKATWAQEMVQPWLPELAIRSFPGRIRTYVDTLPPDYVLPLAISAVDSIESRRDIQDALPYHILNASTGATKVEISRHDGLGSGSCLYCLYLPDVLARSPIELAMARTGFSARDVAEMLIPGSGRLLTARNVRGIASHNHLPDDALRHYVGHRLDELLRDQLWYSQAAVSLDDGQALVTTAFVSALAGFLVLGELLKEADPSLAPYRLGHLYEQELLSVPNEFVYPGTRDETGYCLCHDIRRRRLYHQKYGVA